MKNSNLLEMILSKANEIAVSNQQSRVDSDYFVLATLAFLKEDIIPDGVSASEYVSVRELLEAYFNDFKSAYVKLLTETKKHEKAVLDLIGLRRHQMTAEARALRLELAEVPASFVLENILKEPTESLKEFIGLSSSEIEPKESCVDKVPTKPIAVQIVPPDGAGWDDAIVDEQGWGLPEDSGWDDIAVDEQKDNPSCEKPTENVDVEPQKGEENLVELINKLKRAQTKLLDNVKGQDHAVASFISGCFNAEFEAMSSAERRKPKAIFLFAGPPGVGKTFLAELTAETLGMPFKRFDMSEYADKEANIEFCGSDKVYKNGKPGNVTSYVAKHPKSILLFDEIEKAHINVIHLFLQILDAGRIRDNFTDKDANFKDAILIFTTNAGRKLYEDIDIENLSTVPRKQVLNALTLDKKPDTGEPLFPAAICSRFASGNVILFNRLGADNLLKIAEKEFNRVVGAFKNCTGKNITLDNKALYALMYSEGGNVDARTIKGRAGSFFNQEIYELLRLLSSNEGVSKISAIEEIKFQIEMPEDNDIRMLFEESNDSGILVFSSKGTSERCVELCSERKVYWADDIERAKELLFDHDISLILCDIKCGVKSNEADILNIEDFDSKGIEFFEYVTKEVGRPVYILEEKAGNISQEEAISFMRNGAQGVVALEGEEGYNFTEAINDKCISAVQQNKLNDLSRANKILTFKTKQRLSDDGKEAIITLFGFKLDVAPDVEDGKNIIRDVSRPNVRFDDVIGASDAKGELKYFVNYLKDPITYVRKGVRAPKGVLLYGPPGTGKTLLAKAMAGESDVTFIVAEGNSFLKSLVGEGPELVHEYFRLARKYAPSILFIDEIDAIGKNRSGGDSSSGVAEAVLTAFLTEMDGFKTRVDKPVFVLAATNYSTDPANGRSLDPALLRRFDRRILIDLPNRQERLQYMRLKLAANKNILLTEEHIENIANRSVDMSLAELESVFELALRDAIKAKDFIVDDKCFDNAFESFNNGEVKKRDISQIERTARHEAGHAVISWLAGDKPSYLTIVARGDHGGYMQHSSDIEMKGVLTKDELLSRIRTALAGRAAEVEYYGEKDGISTGASSDLHGATRTAEHMICYCGMDTEIGLSTVDLSRAGDEYNTRIRERVNAILEQEYNNARSLISKNRNAINALVDALLEKNQLKEDEIDAILTNGILNTQKNK